MNPGPWPEALYFKRDLPPLPPTSILQVEVGSGAYGTGLDTADDQDETVVYVEDFRSVLGVGCKQPRTTMHRTAFGDERSRPGDIDRTVYTLRKFLNLALDGNPSILSTFWCPDIPDSPVAGVWRWHGERLKELGPRFIGRHMIPRFRGYAQGQALRLLGLKGNGHGTRGGGGREELIEAHGYDTKYAMHTARLGFFCMELLRNRSLKIPVADHHVLRSIRRGEIDFDTWWGLVLHLDARMEKALHEEQFPEGPDLSYIVNWAAGTHRQVWAYNQAVFPIRQPPAHPRAGM